MNTQLNSPVVIITIFLWIGFVCAISFMEAWLKFQAPGVTLSIGLGIGRLVFSVLNKVEWFFALTVLAALIVGKESFYNRQYLFFLFALIVLILQSALLLPELDIRAALYIEGDSVPHSNLHFYYVGAEVLKVVALAIFGTKRLNQITTEKQQHD